MNGNPSPFDGHILVKTPTGRTAAIGVVGGTYVAAMEITDDAPRVSVVTAAGEVDLPTAPLAELAALLSWADVALAEVVVVTSGARLGGAPSAPLAQAYDELLGPLPAVAHRRTHIVVTLDPQQSPTAIAARGGGARGAARTLAMVIARITTTLARRDVATDVVASATDLITAYRSAHPDLAAQSTAVFDVRRPSKSSVEGVWAAAQSLTVTVTLRPAARATIATPEEIALSARVTVPREYVISAPIARMLTPARASASGHLIVGPPDAFAQWRVPIAGCGQLIGADDSGQAVFLRVPPGVAVHADEAIARQFVLRAVCLGTRVLVCTNRPQRWAPVANMVAAPHALWLAGWEYPDDDRFAGIAPESYDVRVVDGVALSSGWHGGTVTVGTVSVGTGTVGAAAIGAESAASSPIAVSLQSDDGAVTIHYSHPGATAPGLARVRAVTTSAERSFLNA